MIDARQRKLAEDAAKSMQRLCDSLPAMLKKMEKNLSKEDILLIRDAKNVSNFDANLSELAKAQKDFQLFMKKHGGKIK